MRRFLFWEEERGDLTQRALRICRVRREEEENPKSTARNHSANGAGWGGGGCATRMRKSQEWAEQPRPLQVGRLNGTDRGADEGGGAVVWGGVSADGDTAL